MKRVRLLQDGHKGGGPVVYWMSRDQRIDYNRAVEFAFRLAIEHNRPLQIVFALDTGYSGGVLRHFDFMLHGLEQVANRAAELGYGFTLLKGSPPEKISEFIKEYDACVLISDFDPLKIKRIWKREIAKLITLPFYEVDAHNVVPCLVASSKCEFGAYTIRPKITKLLPEFSEPVYEAQPLHVSAPINESLNAQTLLSSINLNTEVKPVSGFELGPQGALLTFENFLAHRFSGYADKRNDPVIDGQSGLSPYIHFGNISVEYIYQTIRERYTETEDIKSFLEELIVRRELADNFCYFNTKYDSFEGFHPWAQMTLNEHRNDRREYLYDANQFEFAMTHDALWNAAQKEMITNGKMHGYMRMYWAKKILEWTESPERALQIALYLNDKYELDGRDPNGFTGCAWSIGGVHDRAWTERPVYGKIRYMNSNGCRRKFDVDAYIAQHR